MHLHPAVQRETFITHLQNRHIYVKRTVSRGGKKIREAWTEALADRFLRAIGKFDGSPICARPGVANGVILFFLPLISGERIIQVTPPPSFSVETPSGVSSISFGAFQGNPTYGPSGQGGTGCAPFESVSSLHPLATAISNIQHLVRSSSYNHPLKPLNFGTQKPVYPTWAVPESDNQAPFVSVLVSVAPAGFRLGISTTTSHSIARLMSPASIEHPSILSTPVPLPTFFAQSGLIIHAKTQIRTRPQRLMPGTLVISPGQSPPRTFPFL